MLHIRVVTPPERTESILRELDADLAAHNIMVFAGASRRPTGDVVQFDVAPEAANAVIDMLRRSNCHVDGSIAIERIDTSISNVAMAAEAHAPGDSSEAVVWEEVESRVRRDTDINMSYLVMMAVAVLIGAVGILLDQPVLIVGAMVVGPDYGPLSAIMLGLHKQRFERAAKGLRTLCVGFGVAIIATVALTAIVRVLGRIPQAYLDGQRPLTSFISQPDGWSVLVAVLAGIAGTLALTELKSATLVGVLISVTTVPAASNIGVALAMGRMGEAGGAALQLLVNVVVLAIAGVVTLALQQRIVSRQQHNVSRQ